MHDGSVRDRLNQLVPAHLFSPARLDRELIADFFMLFARAEFALKKAEFTSLCRSEGEKIVVDWDRFALSLGPTLTDPADPEIRDAVKYLQEKPPQKQVWKNRRIDWKKRECTDTGDPVFVVRSVTTVRNNLFHGGKEVVGLMAERDRELLQNCLLVLAFSLTLNADVIKAFGELGPEVL